MTRADALTSISSSFHIPNLRKQADGNFGVAGKFLSIFSGILIHYRL